MKQLFLFLMFITLQYSGLSQPAPATRAKMGSRVEARRAAFLSERLQLTPEEAQVFFPLFNEYMGKLKTIRQQAIPEKRLEDLSDAEAEKALAAQFDVESRIMDLKKEYYQKWKKVLSPKRIALLHQAEREFKGELLNELQNRRNGKMRKLHMNPNKDDR
jgi:hypothetical protein